MMYNLILNKLKVIVFVMIYVCVDNIYMNVGIFVWIIKCE